MIIHLLLIEVKVIVNDSISDHCNKLLGCAHKNVI